VTRLAGSTVVLTGASGGIGAALAHDLVSRGAQLVATGRDQATLDRLRASLPAASRNRIRTVAADLLDASGRARVLAVAREAAHPVRTLVHAAGSGSFAPFESTGPEAFEHLLQVNVVAPFALTQEFIPLLRGQPEASVVAIGSTFGHLAYPGYAAYSASKHALRGLFEALAREYADTGIRFQWLAPRATRTAFNDARVERMNRELGVAMDSPEAVAARLGAAIERRKARLQIGAPERIFVLLNALFPGLVDRALERQLPVVRNHLRSPAGAEPASPLANLPGVIP
jgi:short-subunit dehydrogenase